MYCAWRIPAPLRCTQCSILLYLMDICFLTCICLWQISQIQTRLFNVVGPGLVSTSPAFVSSSACQPSGPHGRHTQKTVNRAPIAGEGWTQFEQQLVFAVTAPPLVGCVVWSQHSSVQPEHRHWQQLCCYSVLPFLLFTERVMIEVVLFVAEDRQGASVWRVLCLCHCLVAGGRECFIQKCIITRLIYEVCEL